MKYGHFDDGNKEYVIQRPDTPYPWINYLGNEDFFSIISNTAGGYSFYKDARLRRITRYRYNNIPIDSSGKYFYINDNGQVWNPGWQPTRKALDEYQCRHGMGYTIIKGQKNDLCAEVLSFVPLGFNGEVQKLTLKNKSKAKKSFRTIITSILEVVFMYYVISVLILISLSYQSNIPLSRIFLIVFTSCT